MKMYKPRKFILHRRPWQILDTYMTNLPKNVITSVHHLTEICQILITYIWECFEQNILSEDISGNS